MNVASFLAEAAERWPNHPALIEHDRTWSFTELFSRSENLKGALFEAGVRPGMGLGLMARDGVDFITGLFAGLASGAVVMPISPKLTGQELARALEIVPLAAMLHDGSLVQPLPRSAEMTRGSMHIVLGPKERQVRVAPAIPEAAVIRFTSGTTGSSKGVVLSHPSVIARTAAAIRGLSLREGDRVLWVLPMPYHFVVSIIAYMRFGVALVLPRSLCPAEILAAAEEHLPALLYASPAIVQSLSADESARLLPQITRVASTSSGLYPQHALAFRNRFGRRVEQLYGLIEVGLPLGTTLTPSSPDGAVGAPLPGYEVAILDPSGQPLSAGHLGSLAVRGPGMFDAYLAPYRPSKEVLVHGWFLTGDLAIQDSSGHVTVKGREKSVINVSGNKVFPEEVEGVLCSFPGVRAARVYGMERTNTGEMVVAEVVPSPGLSLPIEQLAVYAAERLSSYKLPDAIQVVDAIEMTGSGKIRRAAGA